MHDPDTVAFEIHLPWYHNFRFSKSQKPMKIWASFITVWHHDPEKDGSDDSCDWFGHKLSKREIRLVDSLIDNEYNNLRSFFPDCGTDYHEMKRRITCVFASYKREFKWRWHPRWHFWHWRIQIHPTQQLKRWLFTRCSGCGLRFKWGASVISTSWYGTGPRWFRSERNVYHDKCLNNFPIKTDVSI